MRGEFIGVWSETWREIWAPLIDQEDVPEDIFCELYRELASALKEPVDEDAMTLPLSDAIQLREAFELVPVRAGSDVALSQVQKAFDASGATELQETSKRRAAVETALASLIGDAPKAAALLGQALSELARDPRKRAEGKERAIDRVINNAATSRDAFERVQSCDVAGERALVTFLEAAHSALDDLGGDELSNRYFNLLAGFIGKFSLRYDVRRPCTLSPTLPGIFAGLIRDVERLGRSHPNIARRLRDFNEAMHDLRLGQTEGRISTCIAKQVMLLESLGGTTANVSATELAGICKQIESWPHSAVRPALLGLYGFASDYSGVRHGTESEGRKRDLDTRDLVALSVLLAGFAPYLTDAINADHVYRGV